MRSHHFLSMLYAEHYKAKRNLAVWFILLFPVIVSVLTVSYSAYKLSAENSESMYSLNPWTTLLGTIMLLLYSGLYSFLIAILCYSLCENEYKNGSYKQLFTLPVSITKIYCAKIVYLIEIILLTVLIAYATFLCSVYVLDALFPRLHFQDYDMLHAVFTYFLKLLIALVTIGVAQYCLSLMFKSFVIPLGINCFMGIFAMFFTNKWEHYYLMFYNSSFRAFNAFNEESEQLSKSEYWNMIYIAIFIVAGYFIFNKKKK